MGTQSMAKALASRWLLCVALLALSAGTYAVRRKDEEDSDPDMPGEAPPVLDAKIASGNQAPSQFSEKLPKHLKEHYEKKGLDNVVYFSFCIS